jgi:hypothetical protein
VLQGPIFIRNIIYIYNNFDSLRDEGSFGGYLNYDIIYPTVVDGYKSDYVLTMLVI